MSLARVFLVVVAAATASPAFADPIGQSPRSPLHAPPRGGDVVSPAAREALIRQDGRREIDARMSIRQGERDLHRSIDAAVTRDHGGPGSAERLAARTRSVESLDASEFRRAADAVEGEALRRRWESMETFVGGAHGPATQAWLTRIGVEGALADRRRQIDAELRALEEAERAAPRPPVGLAPAPE